MGADLDLIVLGAGSGGLAAAKRAASHGARVAIVEGDRVGGTCVIRGCVPKKLLVYGAQARHQLADAPAYGLQIQSVCSDVPDLLRRVRAEVDRLNALHLGFLDKAGVQLISGWGCYSPRSHRHFRSTRRACSKGALSPEIPCGRGWPPGPARDPRD